MNDYYVYLHRSKTTGLVFYVGMGRLSRMYQTKDRSVAWKEIAEKEGWYPCLIESFLDQETAMDKELYWMKIFNNISPLVNKKQHTFKAKEISTEFLRDFRIDPTSPSGLSKISKTGIWQHVGHIQYRSRSKEPQGWFINKKPGKIAVHRIIMILAGHNLGVLDVVNHKNCNPLDNSLSNLEICTQAENAKRNRITTGKKLSTKNKSGVTGVIEVCNDNKYYYAMATWSENGITRCKKFSYNKYGKKQAWLLATAYRNSKINEIYGITL